MAFIIKNNMKTEFVTETDKKGRTFIIEGERNKGTFSIKRFICEVSKQETEKETQDLADLIILSLSTRHHLE